MSRRTGRQPERRPVDPRVLAVANRRRQAKSAVVWVAGGGLLYLLGFIAVLSQLRTPLPEWMPLLFLPIPAAAIAVVVLRVWHASLGGKEALAQLHVTRESLALLEQEIAQGRDNQGRESQSRDAQNRRDAAD